MPSDFGVLFAILLEQQLYVYSHSSGSIPALRF